MAKRELIDKTHLLAEIKKLQKSPWYNRGKDDMVVARAFYNERKEAVEVVRDLCVNDEPVITEQEIVKPYLEKLKADIEVAYDELDGYDPDSLATFASRIDDLLDNLLSESEVEK